jgi:hypothetical protein
MQQAHDADDYDLRDEYELSTMTIVPKGRYSPERRMGNNVAILAPDLVEAFPNDEAVNDALKMVLQIAGIPRKQNVTPASP